MKKLILFLALLFLPSSLLAKTTNVKSYIKKDGTFIQGHYRTTPNNMKFNNWSTKGNFNPYTGKKGYKSPYGHSYQKYKSGSYYNYDSYDYDD